jgi:hypothetical protein
MPMFTAPENVTAAGRLARAIKYLVDASDAVTAAKANAVLNVLAVVIAENAAARGADPLDDAAQWAANLRKVVALNLKYPDGLS